MSSLRRLLSGPTLEAAKGLLGCTLTTHVRGEKTSGMIVEVEAYGGCDVFDEACHAHKGLTPRTKIMFDKPGLCYVYFIYGMYHCVNVVTESEGVGAAVLIRALEPLEGIETMKKRRQIAIEKNLANGPGKLCQALAIDKKLLGEDFLSSKKISIEPYQKIKSDKIKETQRIGISKAVELPWRFFIDKHPCVSVY